MFTHLYYLRAVIYCSCFFSPLAYVCVCGVGGRKEEFRCLSPRETTANTTAERDSQYWAGRDTVLSVSLAQFEVIVLLYLKRLPVLLKTKLKLGAYGSAFVLLLLAGIHFFLFIGKYK